MRRTLNVENAKIIFRNFSGKGSKYNREGNRNFAIFLDDKDYVEALREDGWDVKTLKPKDGYEDEEKFYLPISVSYNTTPPKVYMVTRKKKTLLDEDTIATLDFADIENADIILNPYNWEVNGKSGVRAYLKTAYITIAEDEFSNKYEDIGEDLDEIPFK